MEAAASATLWSSATKRSPTVSFAFMLPSPVAARPRTLGSGSDSAWRSAFTATAPRVRDKA